jgi:WD40 repeat protein
MLTWELGDPRFARAPLPAIPRDYHEVIALSPDGQSVATGTRGGEIVISARGGPFVPAAHRPDGAIELLAFSPDGSVLASASERLVLLTDAASGAPLGEIALTADRATLLWWSADGARLVIDTARGFQVTIAVQR